MVMTQKGAVWYSVIAKKDSSDFKIFPVNYAQKEGTHPEVDFINDLVTKKIGRRWKNCHKEFE